MKKLITACCLLSAIFLFENISAQKPGTPCCTILSVGPVDGLVPVDPVGPVDGIVLVRNNTTGQTFQFKPDALDLNSLHVGDVINADLTKNKITDIKGVERGYPINEPNPALPCCSISNIEVYPAAPCCNIVSVQNNGSTYSFSIPKNISSTLKVGQPVSLAMQNSYAFFKTNINGSEATYSYHEKKFVNKTASKTEKGAELVKRITDVADQDSSHTAQTQKLNTGTQPWEIQMDPKIKGIGGEIAMQLPKELRYHTHMEFYEAGDTKNRVASWYGNNNAKLLPGLYDVVVDGKYTIKNVTVELGKQTRLKMGVLKVSNYGSFEIENSNHQKFTCAPPFSIVLPEGTYYIIGKKKFQINIKDGELTEL